MSNQDVIDRGNSNEVLRSLGMGSIKGIQRNAKYTSLSTVYRLFAFLASLPAGGFSTKVYLVITLRMAPAFALARTHTHARTVRSVIVVQRVFLLGSPLCHRLDADT